MKKYIIPTAAALMVAASTAFGAITYFTYLTGSPLTDNGVFYDTAGVTGNAGTVTLDNSYLDGVQLKGYFDIQSVGSGTFQPGAMIVAPPSGNPTRTCWGVDGTAESPNAGTIYLSGTNTDLKFNPVSRRLEGHGYNNGLGRVPFGTGTECDGGIIDDTELATIVAGGGALGDLSASSAGFVGRVKIIGNAGGTTVFDTFYSQGVKFNASLFNTTLQRIRKNVGLLTRNLGTNQKNGTILVGDKMFLIDQSSVYETSAITNARMNEIRSLIVVGGNLYIDKNFTGSTTANTPKGIIVLKNEDGDGGNIYVNSGVTRIDASIFAEGTIYSGESDISLYNDDATKVADLPERQLYILGALISRNTIGGASKSATEVLCPYNEACTFADATKYDLNYFRGFQAETPVNPADPNRAYKDTTLDDYSLIIESDRRAAANPPPGFE